MYSMSMCNDSPVMLQSRVLIHQDSEIMKQINLQCSLNADATFFDQVLVVCYVNCFFGIPRFASRNLYAAWYRISSAVNGEFFFMKNIGRSSCQLFFSCFNKTFISGHNLVKSATLNFKTILQVGAETFGVKEQMGGQAWRN